MFGDLVWGVDLRGDLLFLPKSKGSNWEVSLLGDIQTNLYYLNKYMCITLTCITGRYTGLFYLTCIGSAIHPNSEQPSFQPARGLGNSLK